MKKLTQKPAVETERKLQPVIEPSPDPEDGERIRRLLGRFGICRQDDSAEEAANRLAAMALVLANIAAGHARGQTRGYCSELGVDFVVEGGFASADFVSSVIDPVSWVQDRWERNLLHDVEPDLHGRDVKDVLVREKREREMTDSLLLPAPVVRRLFSQSQTEFCRKHAPEMFPAGVPTGCDAEPGIGGGRNGKTGTKPGDLMPEDWVSEPLIFMRRRTLGREALEYPVFFSTTMAPAALQSRAARAHLGHLLIHSRIDSRATLEKLWKSLAEIAECGTFGRADGSVRVRANLALCADSRLLEEALVNHSDRLRHIPRLLWLVESAPGCELPGRPDCDPDRNFPDFVDACERQIRQRINFQDADICRMGHLNNSLPEWRSFLRERERHLPGISATALNLPTALSFGLYELGGLQEYVDADELVSFAKWLVLRMQNRIAVAVAAGRDSGVERQAAKVAEKLSAEGPMKVRDLQRKGLRLTAGECRTALEWMADRGIVAERDGVWGILSDSRVDVPS